MFRYTHCGSSITHQRKESTCHHCFTIGFHCHCLVRFVGFLFWAGEMPVACQYPSCSREFASRSGAAQHFKSQHTNVRYECTGCHRQLSRRRSLTLHTATCREFQQTSGPANVNGDAVSLVQETSIAVSDDSCEKQSSSFCRDVRSRTLNDNS